jgi:hypothetical protein
MSRLYFKKNIICLFAVLFWVVGTSFFQLSGASQKYVPKKVTFFRQRLMKDSVTKYLLVERAHHYIFQNFVKNDNANREKFDLLVYVYDSAGVVLNRRNLQIFLRRGSDPVHESEGDINLSVFKMSRSELNGLLDENPNYKYLTFRPEKSITANHIDYFVYCDLIEPNVSNGVDSTVTPWSSYLYNKTKKFALGKEFLYLNPSPPAD